MTLTPDHVNDFHSAFYSSSDKISQDQFILKYSKSTKPVKRSQRGQKEPTFVSQFFVRDTVTKAGIPVCKSTFLGIKQVGKNHVDGVIKRNFVSAHIPIEKRGGDTRSAVYAERKQAVINFIKLHKVAELHYCRASIKCRSHLASELSVNKMWRNYNDNADPQLKVKRDYFRAVFNTNFNLGFGTPRTDVCSKCTELKSKISVEKDETKKFNLKVELAIHKKRAVAFFDMLREKKVGLHTISYDCQKNQPMPRFPDQSAYYSRQAYIYNFTIVEGHSHSQLLSSKKKY
jgi:hypothetical protein